MTVQASSQASAAPAPRLVYDLLPVIYRLRDAEQPGLPLSALLSLVEDELQRLRDDVSGLYDDWFIETCAEWAVAYLGDLLGVQGLRPVPESAVSGRALVANTIRYRRAKGTPAVLEQMARDVTGWPARVVEYFALLGTTQHLDHVRPGLGGFASLRDPDGLALTGTAFDPSSRAVDVRHIDSGRGRYQLPNIGLHLWRLAAFRVEGGSARAVPGAGPGCWTFDPAGRDVPLFHPGRPAGPGRVQEQDVPGRLRRRALLHDLAAAPADRSYLTADDPVFRIFLDDDLKPVASGDLICRDLSDWRRPAARPLTGRPVVAVDPVLGRLAVSADAATRRIRVDYAYGLAGDIGAGPFDRRGSLAAAWPGPADAVADWLIRVSADDQPVPGRTVRTLGEALSLWDARPPAAAGQTGVIAIADSASYAEDLDVTVGPGDTLLVVAASLPADEQAPIRLEDVRLTATGLRPHLIGNLRVTGSGGNGVVHVDGLQVEGAAEVGPGDLGQLILSDVTLLRGQAGDASSGWLVAAGNPQLAVHLRRAVGAGVRLPEAMTVSLAESLLYAPDAGPAGPAALDALAATADLDTCTVLGRIQVGVMSASNCLLAGLVEARRRQQGCVRFSYLPLASRTARRHHCLPEPQGPPVVPVFTSSDPASPGFGQLAASGPRAIATGADDEDELGAFHILHQAQRLANLSSQLDQYLRFGLEAGVFFET